MVAEVQCSLPVCKWTKVLLFLKSTFSPLFIWITTLVNQALQNKAKPHPIPTLPDSWSDFSVFQCTSMKKQKLGSTRVIAIPFQSATTGGVWTRDVIPWRDCFLERSLLGILMWTVLNPSPSKWLYHSTKSAGFSHLFIRGKIPPLQTCY